MDPGAVLLALLGSPNLASRRPVYEQYDSTVRPNTVAGPGRGAAIVRIKGTTKALVAATDANQAVGALDPWLGAAMSVAEATRNVSITGARPLGVTNCLNFGDPTEARGVLAAERGRPRSRRRVPGARPAGHRRQRLALQRVAGGRDRTDARDRRRRACSRTSRTLVGPAFQDDGDTVLLVGEASPGWPAASTRASPGRPRRTARRHSTSRSRPRRRRSSARRRRAGCSPRPRT